MRYEAMRQQQIDSLAEELRQTSLKNVNNSSSIEPPRAPVRKHKKQRERRHSEVGKLSQITVYIGIASLL